jgi:Peptidase family M48
MRTAPFLFTLFMAACAPKPASVPSTPMTPGAPIGAVSPASSGSAPVAGSAYPPAATPTAPSPSPGIPPASAVPAVAGAVGLVSLPELRASASQILGELVASLQSGYQQRVTGIPLVVDGTIGDINAFAACDEHGRSAMAITDGLLQVTAYLAQAQAHDELLGTQKVDAYIQQCASQLRPNQPVPAPAPGFFNGAGDPRVIQRQAQVFEEAVAFILGHELGHHYLSHLPCTAGPDALGTAKVGRILSSAVPVFNQPNEIAADLAGTTNLLNAGKARGSRGLYQWSEAGGLLTMRFFAGFDQLTPEGVLLSFEHSHPLPQLRTPIIQNAAATWRSTGGAGIPLLGL